jgi:hypothetical protein
MPINEKEKLVLDVLAEAYSPDEWGAFAFDNLSGATKLERKEVRRACRSLAKKGFAKYERTLVNDDGDPAGAGYRATEEGAALISPCDICGKRATYDYYVDPDGKDTWHQEGMRHILECEKHYEESATAKKQERLI